jgi:hypothetical protein
MAVNTNATWQVEKQAVRNFIPGRATASSFTDSGENLDRPLYNWGRRKRAHQPSRVGCSSRALCGKQFSPGTALQKGIISYESLNDVENLASNDLGIAVVLPLAIPEYQ